MYEFFRKLTLQVAIYYAEILILNGWDSLTNIIHTKIETVIFWGQRAKEYAKLYNKISKGD